MKRPDFLGIGAERAGTSWIYSCLQEHPQLCMPYKELHFFSRKSNWQKGKKWYLTKFKTCENESLIGEYSTSYLSDSRTPKRINKVFNEVKFIVSLRDPIDRAFSSYMNDLASGDLPSDISFDEAIRNKNKYINIGRYATHLSRYLKYFHRDQLLILVYENCLTEPENFINEIFRFLEVDTDFEPSFLEERVNESHSSLMPGLNKLINQISKNLRSNPIFRKVWWKLKTLGLGKFVRSINSASQSDQVGPSDKSKNYLRSVLSPEVHQLENTFEIDLSEWQENFPNLNNRARSNA